MQQPRGLQAFRQAAWTAAQPEPDLDLVVR